MASIIYIRKGERRAFYAYTQGGEPHYTDRKTSAARFDSDAQANMVAGQLQTLTARHHTVSRLGESAR